MNRRSPASMASVTGLMTVVFLVMSSLGCQPADRSSAPAGDGGKKAGSSQSKDRAGGSADAKASPKASPHMGGTPDAQAAPHSGGGAGAKDVPLENLGKCLSACATMSDEGPAGGMRGLCSAGCYTAEAKRAKDPEICDKRMVGEMAGMHDICLSSVADEAGDADICDRIKSDVLSASCRINVAKRLKDPAPCKKIKDAGYRAACEAAVKE